MATTIHFRADLDLYPNPQCHLVVLQGGNSIARFAPVGITSYGAVFRVNVKTPFNFRIANSNTLHLADGTSEHIVLSDADTISDAIANADRDINSNRLLLVMFNYTKKTSIVPWIMANSGTMQREFFPRFQIPSIGNRAVMFVDRNMFNSSSDINLCVCTKEDQLLLSSPLQLERHAVWENADASNVLHVEINENEEISASFDTCDTNEVLNLVRAEAKYIAGMSEMITIPHKSDSAPMSNGNGNGNSVSGVELSLTCDMSYPYYPSRLRVYFLNFDHTSPLYSLQVKSIHDPSNQWTIRREKELVRECSLYFVDLSYQPRDVIQHGYSITPIHVVTKIPYTENRPLVWKPELGYNVAIVQSYNGLQMIQDLEHTVMYHRFENVCEDSWDAWQLKVWSQGDDGNASHEFSVHGQPQASSNDNGYGTILFDCAGIILPKGTKLYVQPVKSKPAGLDGTEREIVFRDVVREWTAGDIKGGDIHIVQGDAKLRTVVDIDNGIDRDRSRFVKIRYRRYHNDYYGWKLYAWEDFQDIRTAVTIHLCKDEQVFVLDRGNFGVGTNINLLPQFDDGENKGEDQPIRSWKAHEQTTDMNDVYIIEGTSAILTEIEDAHKSLRAQVNGDGEVEISAAAPFQWFANAESTDINSFIPPVSLDLVLHSKDKTQKKKTSIPVRQTRVISPVKFSVALAESDLLLNEDFPIEHIHLCVDGFDTTRLMWKQSSDADSYYYAGNLGLEYTPKQSSFRCFAPHADNVSVVLYSDHTENGARRCVKMRRIPQGCWKTIIKKDLKGMYYKLLATGKDKLLFPGIEVIDPYARCNTGHTGRSYIYGYENTEIAPRPNIPVEDTIVYELHVRDATIDSESGVEGKGKFLGLTERGTKMQSQPGKKKQSDIHEEIAISKYSTGLDHIIEMGVTAVQIMPIQDFDNDERSQTEYRWGYMPVHFNSPDGWYASSVTDASRITEFKKMVDCFHKNNIKVIMDVVYNHTAEDSNERNLDARFSFNGLAPRYYYRTCGNTPVASNGDRTCGKLQNACMENCGSCYSNGSGCGNEFRSEAPMGRKFIIDSLVYWVTEYGVDGFRFDLLGLMDLETMKQATMALHAIDPNIVVYGEPWCGGLTPIEILDKGKQRTHGFGVFNNTLRDAIRGSPFGLEETFVMDGGRITEMKQGIIGSIDSFTSNAMETINYVECHDNYTLWDHMEFYIKERCDSITFTNEDIRRMHALAAVIVFTSQGIPFIQMGQEMCRTKYGEENSYESPDSINMIQWEEKIRHWRNVRYYAGLIKMRKMFPHIWALKTPQLIRQAVTFYEDVPLNVPERCVAFLVANAGTEMVVCLNPTPSDEEFALPGGTDDTLWIQIVDDRYAGTEKIAGPFVAAVMVRGRGAAVLRKATGEEIAQEQVRMRLACVTGAYTSGFGDDVLGDYAVSLRITRSGREKVAHERLVERRKKFMESSTAA